MSPEDDEVPDSLDVVSGDMDVEDMSPRVVSLPTEPSVVPTASPDDEEPDDVKLDVGPVPVEDVPVDASSAVTGDSPQPDTATTIGNKHFQQPTSC